MPIYSRTASVRSTAELVAQLPAAVITERARHLLERDRQNRLAQAKADVEAAEEALERARRVVVETKTLDAARARLAAIENEVIGPQ
ncbi:hypothetical protein [Rhodopseudomonas telluris]|uniref:Uncharacterized protein n=1 Tax=Rhodopseudomonas telluris TaxID=644215 RepID=A0ABV6EZC2_9BRAD